MAISIKSAVYVSVFGLIGLTHIVYADVVLDGSMGTTGSFNADNIEITADMGRLDNNNSNLFHSFQKFDVNTGQRVNFSGPASVNNIFGRITGDSASNINGTISSSIDQANLYLINPNGIMFGADATINISGSFYGSTADYLKFDDNSRYYASINESVSFISASPSAFGFLSDNPASIDVAGSQLSVDSGRTLALVGGNINVKPFQSDSANAKLIAGDGQVSLISAASQGVVEFDDGEVEMTGFDGLGTITLDSGSFISTSGDSGGQVVVRGGKLVMKTAVIEANISGLGHNDADFGIDIDLKKELSMNDSLLRSYVTASASRDGNDVIINANEIRLDNWSAIDIGTEYNSEGNGGDLTLNSTTFEMTNNSLVNTQTSGVGTAGDIKIDSTALGIYNGSYINTSAYFSGDAGNIFVKTDDLEMNNDFNVVSNDAFTGIAANTGNIDSNGANIQLKAKNIHMDNLTLIFTLNTNKGENGNITIEENNELTMLNGAQLISQADSTYESEVTAGDVNINAKTINFDGGHILDDIYIKSGIYSFADSGFFGNNPSHSSTIYIETDNINLTNGGYIESSSVLGKNGDITVKSKNISISGYYQELYNAKISEGLRNEDALKSAASSITTLSIADPNQASTKTNNFGNVIVKNQNNMTLSDNAYIATDTWSTGNAGDITIDTKSLEISSGAYLSSESAPRNTLKHGPGNSGDITITSKIFSIDGSEKTGERSGVFTRNNIHGGAAGDLTINSDTISITNNATLSSSTASSKQGGNIVFNASKDIYLSGNSEILTMATDSGDAGDITILNAKNLKIIDNSIIRSTTTKSNGGNVNISTSDLILLANSAINTDVETGFGLGGSVSLTSSNFVLDSSSITTTADKGNGGDIDITAGNIYISFDSIIDASSNESVDGNININPFNFNNSGLNVSSNKAVDLPVITNGTCDPNIHLQSNFVIIQDKNTAKSANPNYLAAYLGEEYFIFSTKLAFDYYPNINKIIYQDFLNYKEVVLNSDDMAPNCQIRKTI